MILAHHRVRGTLTAVGSVHIGADRADALIDLPLVRDGRGRPVLPGTSLAGSLRTHLLDAGHDTIVNQWFGATAEDPTHTSSKVIIDDAPAVGGTYLTDGTEVRTTTSIDPRTGAAARTALYARETVPRGTTFDLSMEIDETDLDTDVPTVLRTIVDVLRGGITVGAAGTRGLGRIALTDVEHQLVPLTDRSGFLRFLSGQPCTPLPATGGGESASTHTLDVTAPFLPRGPLMSAVHIDGSINRVPLTTSSSPGRVRLLLPGSSIKGALRARAVYILGTLGAPDPHSDDAFRLLFGAPSTRPPQRIDDHPESMDSAGESTSTSRGDAALLGRGRLRVGDSTALTEMSRHAWDAVALPDDDSDSRSDDRRARRHLAGSLRAVSDDTSVFVIADRVAIDRWTGGAADKRLFSQLEPHTRWTPLRLELNLRGISPGLATRGIGLLSLILRELADGWIPLGYGTRRGLGAISIDPRDVTVAAGTQVPAWHDPSTCTFDHLLASEHIAAAVTATVSEYPTTEATPA
ncbi:MULTISPECIES: RAMP superfamily CRISPR-associated protein [unclassified Gordonia (in: high G+C Gram-positive bacteria)]|uniref:RAMP superfamily CRISPR-associated protein n=1 Tax=unclassified Gordonia (in: high G+C Gram-positive bacteria) TaxID=2657482 RepID=UPI00071DC1FA|nr:MULTISPECIES: RAMP superfamily CRISPR-associated protein [unclassified Gordonia (in: high G+C Gram-positive bacteria)]KSU56128.1 hypothetical protein AS181_18985 [Gordonia sp. SGD-V-85]SCC49389.1 CRISPR/Cas system CSM-associated protein Csm3, group 7 of RAMP superfamily [Gordonia sp. v-85]